MQAIMARIRYEHDHAHEGPAFDRLKRAHPEANDADIKQAIRSAVKPRRRLREVFRYEQHGLADAIESQAGEPRISGQHLAGRRPLSHLLHEAMRRAVARPART